MCSHFHGPRCTSRVLVPGKKVARSKTAVDMAAASDIFACGSTALKMICTAGVHDGHTMLVNGASGSVKSILILLCNSTRKDDRHGQTGQRGHGAWAGRRPGTLIERRDRSICRLHKNITMEPTSGKAVVKVRSDWAALPGYSRCSSASLAFYSLSFH
jgi:hypothetical protein